MIPTIDPIEYTEERTAVAVPYTPDPRDPGQWWAMMALSGALVLWWVARLAVMR